ncbi:reverse transcriptase [Gossypium australe]|uniref:Reverse transcriptase n=1 Tax=Gossypium australe TaxID=47621 RepID=A0A5B6WK80_9ROSI|nr:reverse transcriptase [Gossypium australe]
MDGPISERSTRLLKLARGKLGHLYEAEEKYWAQRARTQWLREGDRNTRYFHYGAWHEDKNEICTVAWSYFDDLFKSTVEPDEEFDLHFVPKCITDNMNRNLNREVTDAEILAAFNQMDPRKARGIDGLLGMGDDVLRLFHETLRGTNDVDRINETLLVMIPKIENPCEMTNFHPIRLFIRSSLKYLRTVLANCLKEVLSVCISQNQRAFVPGRMIHDNVLIAHELMHYLRSSKNGPNKGCVVKLDMSKAYDRVEWCFLEKVLLKIGFSCDWVKKFMSCVRTVIYRVKCNMRLTDVIIPERGLCQGDPFIPLPFSLLHGYFISHIKGICASKDGPRINHLFFADDALLFVRNQRSEVEVFNQILEKFEKMFGQSINLENSMVCFSPNTSTSQMATTSGLLKMNVVDKLDGYLGLPIPVGKKKRNAFKSILDRTACRINSWSKRLLSYGSKEIFLKAVIQSIPTYAFSVFFGS